MKGRKKNHVSVRRLIGEGRKKAKLLKIKTLKFSWGWVSKFLKRNNFALKNPKAKIGKEIESLQKDVLEFKEKIVNLRKTNNYDLDFVINIDETGIATETTRAKTVVLSQEFEEIGSNNVKEATVKSCNKEKEITTVLLGGSWNGHKIPALIILKGKGVKKKESILPQHVRVQYRERFIYDIMKKWIKTIFKDYALKLP